MVAATAPKFLRDPSLAPGPTDRLAMTGPTVSLRLAVLALTTGLIAAVAAVGPSHAISIELKDVASDRIERQRAAAEGNLPLAGTPDLARLNERLAEKGLAAGAPVLLQAFKSESEFEVWIRKDDTYVLFATYPVCHWSGTLGPKLREGDKQTPEGFYTVTKRQMRHVGRWPRSLNLGFPNVFDQVQARNGSHILVHGGCSSVGCFAMTNAVVEEIYNLTERAVAAGQTFVPVHVFPFRLTDANLAQHKDSPWHAFWANLKDGHDFLEKTKRAPRVSVCEGKYKFHDMAPEEGADPGPLAPCGETLAALEALERLSPAAQTLLSLEMNPPRLTPRSLAANAHLHPMPSNLRDRVAAATLLLAQRGLVVRPSPEAGQTLHRANQTAPQRHCSMARASCRHFVANHQRMQDKRTYASARKRQITATR